MLARDLMTMREVFSASDSDDAISVARLLAARNVASLPVVDRDGRLLGIVTDRDLACRILAEGRSYETPVRDIMSSPFAPSASTAAWKKSSRSCGPIAFAICPCSMTTTGCKGSSPCQTWPATATASTTNANSSACSKRLARSSETQSRRQ